MSILLTDDEVVAAVIQLGAAWPKPLPTVEHDTSALSASGARGARSLLVRGLAVTRNSALTLDDAVVVPIRLATSASELFVAYVAEAPEPALLAGSSNLLFTSSDGEAVIDLVSANGVHAMRMTSHGDGIDLLLALAQNAFNLGVAGGGADAEPVLVVARDGAPLAALVSKGHISVGTLQPEDGGTFQVRASTSDWDVGALVEVLGLTSSGLVGSSVVGTEEGR